MFKICNMYFFSTATLVTRKCLNVTFIRKLHLVAYSNRFTTENCVTLTTCNTDQLYTEHRK